MDEKKVLRKNKDMVTRTIDDETVFIPIYKSSSDINCIYTLNKSASKVWEKVDGKRKLSEIKKEILKDFDASPEEVDKKMRKLLEDLKKIKAIK